MQEIDDAWCNNDDAANDDDGNDDVLLCLSRVRDCEVMTRFRRIRCAILS